MKLVILLIAATVIYTIFDLLIAKAGGKLNGALAAGIFHGIGAVIPLFIYLTSSSKNNIETTTPGLVYTLLAGVSIAAFSLILVYLFSKAENVSFILPVIYGGTVVLGTLAGVFLFKESLTTAGILGIILTSLGVGLIIYSRLSS